MIAVDTHVHVGSTFGIRSPEGAVCD